MPGVIFPIPTDASGAPEANRWQGTQTEPTLAQRIAGHVPYPGAPPAYDIENYARDAQWQNNLRLQAAALVAERQSQTVTLAGATVGNQRRITVNGTNIDYSDTIGQTVSDVADSFALAINANVTVTAGANAVYAVGNIAGAGTVTILSLVPGIGTAALVVTVAVLAGAGTITVGTLTAPDIVISEDLIGSAAGNIVLGFSADDAGPNNDVRLVLDRNNNAFRAGGTTGTEWDTRSLNSVGIGWRADPQADNSLALGTQAVAAAVADLAIGKDSAANNGGGGNDPATAIGGATATGEAALAAGFAAAATAAGAAAIGANATASAANASAIGDVDATGIGATAAGYKTVSSGAGALATGQQSDSLGPVVTASGAGSRAHARTTNTFATAAGATTASGVGSDAFGQGSKAVGDYSLARGLGAETTDQGEVAEGGIGIDGNLSVDSGKHQAGRVVVQSRTVGAQTRYLSPSDLDASAANSPAWTPHDDRGWIVRVRVVAKDIAAGNVETWTCEGAASKDAGTLAISAGLSGAMTVGDTLGTAVPLTPPSISASTGSLVIEVVGATNDYRWTGQIEYVQAGINY